MGKRLILNLCLFFLLNQLSFCQDVKPPAVPLVLSDPYFSCWSFGNILYAGDTRHWTGKKNEMHGIIRVDGQAMTFMGETKGTTAKQLFLQVNPTQSIYKFKCGPTDLTLTFTSPLLLTDLDILSRPASYITFEVRSNDGKTHDVQIYFDAAANWAVHDPEQKVEWKRLPETGMNIMRVGTTMQNILGRKGDDVRIDWGYLYMTSKKSPQIQTVITNGDQSQSMFSKTGSVPASDDDKMPRPASVRSPSLVTVYNLGKIDTAAMSDHLIIAYDDIYSIEYFHRRLRAWWRRNDSITAEKMLVTAEKDYPILIKRCEDFDQELIKEAREAGGEEYAELCALTYRQAIAAHKLVADSAGRPLFFSKENFSNGSIGTVDVTYPSAPLFLLYNPTLVKGMIEPIFNYSESGKWKKPFAAHDLGTYPIANGQTYPEDMPVEECGNMIILTAAIAETENSTEYARIHWEVLTQWVEYLKKDGFDCSEQLCTDDFAGHLARNTNLSIKTIIALASYAKLAEKLGYTEEAKENKSFARALTKKWIEGADAGDHYSLAFEREDTWSQKYNLVWDQLLDLDLFPEEVKEKELKFYLTKQNKYGLPLDSRKTYTKSDWVIWTATLSDSKEEFKKFIHPIYLYVHETPDKLPLNDWHETTNAKAVGFQARSVVGGYFIKILDKRLKGPIEETGETRK